MLVLLKVASKQRDTKYSAKKDTLMVFEICYSQLLVFKVNYRLHFFKYVSSQIFYEWHPILSNFLKVFYRLAEQCCVCINYYTNDLTYYLVLAYLEPQK